MKLKISEGNLERDKLEITKCVTILNDDTSIEKLKMLKNSGSQSDWWEQISDEEKQAVNKGLADIKAGRLKPHEEVKKLYEKWL